MQMGIWSRVRQHTFNDRCKRDIFCSEINFLNVVAVIFKNIKRCSTKNLVFNFFLPVVKKGRGRNANLILLFFLISQRNTKPKSALRVIYPSTKKCKLVKYITRKWIDWSYEVMPEILFREEFVTRNQDVQEKNRSLDTCKENLKKIECWEFIQNLIEKIKKK